MVRQARQVRGRRTRTPAPCSRAAALALPKRPAAPGSRGTRAGAGRKRPENARRPLTKRVTRPSAGAAPGARARAHRGRAPATKAQRVHRRPRVAQATFVVHYCPARSCTCSSRRAIHALSTGMRRLVIGLALRLNQALGRGRRGKVWAIAGTATTGPRETTTRSPRVFARAAPRRGGGVRYARSVLVGRAVRRMARRARRTGLGQGRGSGALAARARNAGGWGGGGAGRRRCGVWSAGSELAPGVPPSVRAAVMDRVREVAPTRVVGPLGDLAPRT